MADALERFLIGELTTPVAPEVEAFAESLAASLDVPPLGLLFYGSTLRAPDPAGILDFYIVTESADGFSGGALARLGNRLLPPNVRYAERRIGGRSWRAKIATLSAAQFRSRTALRAADTTIWARFCQPVRLVWVRGPDAADTILGLVARSVTVAACWAALLGPESASAPIYWEKLFRATYAAELRVERAGRGRTILSGREARFATALQLGWSRAGVHYTRTDGLVHPEISQRMRERAARRWGRVRSSGKLRNVARLLKAAFTFENGAAYLAWKIRRHTGLDLCLTPFEARHPILMLPVLLWRARALRRGGKG